VTGSCAWGRTLPERALVFRAEYETGPVWDADRAGRYVDPDGLYLLQRLHAWVDRYDSTLDREHPPSSGFASEPEREAFEREGIALVEALMRALPGNVDSYQSDAVVRRRP
jgi:hypothetical protein